MSEFIPSSSSSSSSLPSVLVLGGCGFIGRNLVHHLVSRRLCRCIKVTDKTRPDMSYFHEQFLQSFDSEIVFYEQNDLTKEQHVARAFRTPDGHSGDHFDIVINLAAETRQGQPIEQYHARCTLLAKLCSERAAASGVSRFIQVSTGQVYKCSKSFSPNSSPADERSAIEPWTTEAKHTREGELEVLNQQENIEVVILRLAYVYGNGDTQMVMTRAVCGAVYAELKEEMTLLWGKQLKINTVHVTDVCRSIGFAFHSLPRSSVWNICDKTDTDQEHICKLLKSVFGMKYGFYGRITSNIASLRLQEVANTANEKHLKPWNDICMRDNVLNTPLSPYMGTEWLDCRHLHISGVSIETLGFTYEYPIMTEELFRSSIRHAVECGTFPPSCCSL